MAILKANRAVGPLQGSVEGLVYTRRADGVVVVREANEGRFHFNAAQRESQKRFANATLYLKRLKASPERYAPYIIAGKIRRKRL